MYGKKQIKMVKNVRKQLKFRIWAVFYIEVSEEASGTGRRYVQ